MGKKNSLQSSIFSSLYFIPKKMHIQNLFIVPTIHQEPSGHWGISSQQKVSSSWSLHFRKGDKQTVWEKECYFTVFHQLFAVNHILTKLKSVYISQITDTLTLCLFSWQCFFLVDNGGRKQRHKFNKREDCQVRSH